MNIEQLKLEIEAKKAGINEAYTFIEETQQAIAEHLCPFKVGQAVLCSDAGECVVASIHFKVYAKGYGVKLYKTKKAGGLYLASIHAYGTLTAGDGVAS